MPEAQGVCEGVHDDTSNARTAESPLGANQSVFGVTFAKASFQATDEVISIRASADVKDLLRHAAKGQRRSVAPMVEVLEIACGTLAKVY